MSRGLLLIVSHKFVNSNHYFVCRTHRCFYAHRRKLKHNSFCVTDEEHIEHKWDWNSDDTNLHDVDATAPSSESCLSESEPGPQPLASPGVPHSTNHDRSLNAKSWDRSDTNPVVLTTPAMHRFIAYSSSQSHFRTSQKFYLDRKINYRFTLHTRMYLQSHTTLPSLKGGDVVQ